MDNFCEQLVTKKQTGAQIFIKYLLVLLLFLIGLVAIILLSYIIPFTFAFVASGVIVFIGINLINNSNFEYEYIFTNGELDVDKIIAKRQRKRILTVDIKSFSSFGKLSNETIIKNMVITKIMADDGIAENTYYADFKSSKHGQTRLYFSPNERLLENMKHFLPRNLKI